jgi:hypothetical protein
LACKAALAPRKEMPRAEQCTGLQFGFAAILWGCACDGTATVARSAVVWLRCLSLQSVGLAALTADPPDHTCLAVRCASGPQKNACSDSAAQHSREGVDQTSAGSISTARSRTALRCTALHSCCRGRAGLSSD